MPLTLEQHERKLRDPAMCEQLPVRDYLDNIVVRTNGAFVAGYELKGLASYFASDEGRDRGKLMLEALLRSLPEQSMRVQFRYEVVEDLGDLLEQYGEAQQSERAEVIALDELRVERWRMKEANGHYMRPLLHVYFIWDPVVHRRIAGKPLKPTGKLFSLSARKCIERGCQEHHQLLAEFESLLRGLETTLEAAELGASRLTDEDLFLEAKRALNPLAPDRRPYRRGEEQLEYRSAREQIVDTSIAEGLEVISSRGQLKFRPTLLKHESVGTFWTGIRSSERGDRIAVDMLTIRGGNRTLDISGHVTARRIAVYDIEAGKELASIPVNPKHRYRFEFDVSPDGHLLAILEDDVVRLIDIEGAAKPEDHER